MFKFGKARSSTPPPPLASDNESDNASDKEKARQPNLAPNPPASSPSSEKSKGLFGALSRGLKKTRSQLTEGLANLLLGEKVIDASLLEALEVQLLAADVGIAATQNVIADMTARVKRKEVENPQALARVLQESL